MYSRYMPPRHTFRPIPASDAPPSPSRAPHRSADAPAHHRKPPDSDLLGELTGGVKDFLNGLFDGFSLEHLDSGDILLILIVLFLFLEGDDLDLVIALGLMLLLGLGGKES